MIDLSIYVYFYSISYTTLILLILLFLFLTFTLSIFAQLRVLRHAISVCADRYRCIYTNSLSNWWSLDWRRDQTSSDTLNHRIQVRHSNIQLNTKLIWDFCADTDGIVFIKFNRHRVDAVTCVCRCLTLAFEYMAQVSIAARAHDFDPHHPVGDVFLRLDGAYLCGVDRGGIGVGVNVAGTGCTSISVEYTCIRHRGVTMSTDSNVREKVSINPLTLVAFIKSRPSTARIKFGLSGIQRIAAGSAFEVARGGVFFV